jgi:hypothetical protein
VAPSASSVSREAASRGRGGEGNSSNNAERRGRRELRQGAYRTMPKPRDAGGDERTKAPRVCDGWLNAQRGYGRDKGRTHVLG